MNSRLLIDALVQQTTVLIAQLSTAAGMRSPLAHVADQVFLSLAQEIERQGVSRKIVADMFGLALRTYQRKVQRLSESTSQGGRTLWESVLEFVAEEGPAGRGRVIDRFRNDDQRAVISVLADLVASGLLYSSGRGEAMVYRATSEADRTELTTHEDDEALATLVWGAVFRGSGVSLRDLVTAVPAGEERVRAALALLLSDGRVTRKDGSDDAPLHAPTFLVPHDATVGWEAAVFDHYQAMANALAAKTRRKGSGAPDDGSVGGSTLHFGVHPGHPYEGRVLGMLHEVRGQLNALWNEVVSYNRAHPIPDEEATRVTFYFGQHVRAPGQPVADAEDSPAEAEREEDC